jgi:hypothetical protein
MARLVKLQDIKLDGGTQYREEIDQNKVKEYAEAMDNEAVFPPIQCTFDGSTYWLWDGFHRYFAWQSLGAKTIEVIYTPGTQEDAQDLALSANSTHGIARSNETKRKQVEAALSMERHANKSDREIAKLCAVSVSFVGAIRRPEVKERQAKNLEKHFENKAAKEGVVKLQPDVPATPATPAAQDYGPSEEELKANELAEQADRELLNKMLEADDALAVSHAENKRLNLLVAQKEMRIAALMNEKNAAIKHAQSLEKQLKKATKK